MANLTINNTTTVTSITGARLNVMANLTINNTTTVTSITGARLNVIAIVGKQGAQGIPGIDGTGAGVVGLSSLNGLTGTVNLTGYNGTQVFTSGNTIFISGGAGSSTVNISGYITTGQADARYYPLGSNPSGYLVPNQTGQFYPASNPSEYVTSGNLTLTGVQLINSINSLSGYVGNVSGGLQAQVANSATAANLASTGSQAWNAANNNSINLSGNLAQTGALLRSNDALISGFLTTGLTNTGVLLYSLITSLSGQANTNYATVTNLASTGQQAIAAANNNSINLSGNLTSTGVQLGNSINSLSGYLGNVSGGLQAQIIGAGGTQVKITGSATLSTATFTGIGGLLVFLSGSTVFISGASAGGITQGQLDALSGWAASNTNLALTGSNLYNLVVNLSGQANSNFATIVNVTSTGAQLVASINSLSGYVGNVSGGLQSQIATKASLTTTDLISGNLIQTGVQLVTSINSLSGFIGNISGGLQAQIGTAASITTVNLVSGNLIQTGVQLGNSINSLSGYIGNVSGGLQSQITTRATIVTTDLISGNLASTGQQLYNLITGMSGQDVINFATKTQLTQTGATLFQRDLDISGALAALISSNAAGVSNLNGLSGSVFIASAGTNITITPSGQTIYVSGTNIASATNLTTTGSNLYNLITGMSGQTVIDYATKTNVTSTGVQLGNSISSLSGYIGNVSGGLQSQIGTAASITTVNLISGNLIQTGVQLGNSINSLSGYLGNVSGGLQSQIAAGDTAISTNLTNTGITLTNRDTLISGILTTGLINTGAALYSIIVGMSGQNSIDYATRASLLTTGQTLYNLITGASGQAVIDYATKSSLLSTGQQAWSAANNNGINLSGNLTQTGVQLVATNVALSGFVGNISGGLQSQIATRATITTTDLISGNLRSTGQQLYNLITGASGQAVIDYATKTNLTATGVALAQRDLDISGVLAALISSNAAGVSNLNGLSGSVFIASAGTNITITPSGQTIYVSGSNIASATNLGATGSYLYNLLTGVSGTSAPVNLSGYITTGQADLRYYPLIGNPSGYVTGSYYTTDQIDNLFLYVNPYFFDGGLSNISGYRLMISNYPSGNNTYTGTINPAVDGQYITGFITESGFPGLNGFIRGTNTASIHAYKGAANQKSVIPYYKLYAYDTTTSLTRLINTSTLGAGLELTAVEQHLYYTTYITGFNITPSDRLIINWYANVIPGGGAAPSVSVVWGDATDAAESLPVTSQLLATTYYPTTNPSGFIATGITGQFYASSNPQQYVTSGNLTNSGVQLINRDFLISGILTTGLTNTGALLVATDVALSGYLNNVSGGLQAQVDTKASITTTNLISGNLASTGQILGTSLTATGVLLVATSVALSGFVGNVSGGLQSQIATRATITTTDLISGNLIQTGVQLVASISSLSGFVGNVSGGLQAQINTKASIATVDLVSGNLTATGVALITRINSVGSTISGNLTQTGIDLIIRLNSVGSTISGNLTQTGVQLVATDIALSGYIGNVSGGLQAQIGAGGAQIKVTGSVNLSLVDFSGIGGTLVILSGNKVLISGGASGPGGGSVVKVTGSSDLTTANFTGSGATTVSYNGTFVTISSIAGTGAGVASINSMNNAVTLIGTGGLVVTSVAGVIAISGFRGVKASNILFNNSGVISGNDNLEWHDEVGTLEIGEPGILYPDNPLNMHGSGAYLQATIRNLSNLPDASSDFVLTTNVGSDTSGYLDLGINNSNYFNEAYSMGRGGDGYLYVNGGHLDLATQTTGKNIQFFTNSTTSGSLRMTIHDTGISIPTGHALIIGDPIFLPNNPLAIAGSGNTYVQVSLQNRSSGFSAQADFILTADVGTDTNNFVDLGINNSNFADTGYQLYKPLDGFLYNRGGDMFLGTATPGYNVQIHAGGIASGDTVAIFSKTGVTLPTGKAFNIGSTSLGVNSFASYENFAVVQSGLVRSEMIMSPSFWSRHITAITPATTTSQTVIGNTVAAAVGTVSTLSDQILGQYTNIVSAATSFVAAGESVTTAYYFRGSITGKNGFFFTSTFALTDGNNLTGAYTLSGARVFIGMTDQTTSATVLTNDPAGNRIGLTFCWATGGTQGNKFEKNWFISSKNNVTEFTGVSAMNFQTGFYRFNMYAPPFTFGNTGVIWEIEDLLRGSGTKGVIKDNLPIGSTALRPSAYVLAASGGARNLKICNLYVENPSFK